MNISINTFQKIENHAPFLAKFSIKIELDEDNIIYLNDISLIRKRDKTKFIAFPNNRFYSKKEKKMKKTFYHFLSEPLLKKIFKMAEKEYDNQIKKTFMIINEEPLEEI